MDLLPAGPTLLCTPLIHFVALARMCMNTPLHLNQRRLHAIHMGFRTIDERNFSGGPARRTRVWQSFRVALGKTGANVHTNSPYRLSTIARDIREDLSAAFFFPFREHGLPHEPCDFGHSALTFLAWSLPTLGAMKWAVLQLSHRVIGRFDSRIASSKSAKQ